MQLFIGSLRAKFMVILMKPIRIVQLLALISITAFCCDMMAQDKAEPHLPDHYGFSIGMDEQEMLTALGSQGFSFKDGGEYERVRGSKEYAPMLDYVLVVSKEAGASAIWNAGNVMLGVKDGSLVAIGEAESYSRFEGYDIYRESISDLDTAIGPADGILPIYQARKAKEFEQVNQFDSLIWHLQERASSEADPETTAWIHDNVLTVLAVRYDSEIDRRTDKYHRTVILWHLDYCAFPVLDKFYKKQPIECGK